ncbi:MAG: GNAT family N-acetyltransferase [bacterium]|jgi:RimJ/RimL family protein N-acetyltransferase|nr:GNAT family N-acetyltransferase [bacterium]
MACTAEDLYRTLIEDARRLVEAAAHRLRESGPEDGAVSSGWTAAQVLGHLWDSAQVNHLRLLRGMAGDDLIFPGYDQDAWVGVQDPATLPWELLVEGWRADNLRLLHLAGRLEPVLRTRLHPRHSLDRIGWQPHPAHLPASLEHLIRDYLGHLRHHLRRLSPALVPPSSMPAALDRAVLPLRTGRLVLEPLRTEDVDELAPILADPAVVRHLPGPPRSREQTAKTIAHFVAHQERLGFSAWALRMREDGRLAGWCGLAELDGTGEVELLYCLGTHAWGRGIASEAARACLACARDQLGLPRLAAVVAPDNQASRRVLATCGLDQRRPARHFGLELEWWQIDFDKEPT